MSRISSELKKYMTPGTPACAALYAFIGVVLAVLLLTIGVWKTLFILAFGAVGALIGGIGNKQEAVRSVVNRRFPARDLPLKNPPEVEKSSDTDTQE